MNTEESVINTCSTSGRIEVTGSDGNYNLGGIAGANSGTIEKSYNDSSIYGIIDFWYSRDARIGGVIGANEKNGNAKNVFNKGDIYIRDNKQNKDGRTHLSGIIGKKFGKY